MTLSIRPFVLKCPSRGWPILNMTANRYRASSSPVDGLTLLFFHCNGARVLFCWFSRLFPSDPCTDKEHWEPVIEYLFSQSGSSRLRICEAWAFDWPTHGDAGILNQELLRNRTEFVCEFQSYSVCVHIINFPPSRVWLGRWCCPILSIELHARTSSCALWTFCWCNHSVRFFASFIRFIDWSLLGYLLLLSFTQILLLSVSSDWFLLSQWWWRPRWLQERKCERACLIWWFSVLLKETTGNPERMLSSTSRTSAHGASGIQEYFHCMSYVAPIGVFESLCQ